MFARMLGVHVGSESLLRFVAAKGAATGLADGGSGADGAGGWNLVFFSREMAGLVMILKTLRAVGVVGKASLESVK